MLAALLKDEPYEGLWFSGEVEGRQGAALFRQACATNLEGIVSKRKGRPCRSGAFEGLAQDQVRVLSSALSAGASSDPFDAGRLPTAPTEGLPNPFWRRGGTPGGYRALWLVLGARNGER